MSCPRLQRRNEKDIGVYGVGEGGLNKSPRTSSCQGLSLGLDRKEGGAAALEDCVEVEVSDVIPFIPANKREWLVRSGSVRAVKFNKVVL